MAHVRHLSPGIIERLDNTLMHRAETVFSDHLIIAQLDHQANASQKHQRPHDAFTVHQQTQSAVETAYEDYLENITNFTTVK